MQRIDKIMTLLTAVFLTVFISTHYHLTNPITVIGLLAFHYGVIGLGVLTFRFFTWWVEKKVYDA